MATYGKSMTLSYVAWDTSNNVGKTGDVANHTLRWIKDGTSAAPSNAASEVDATNAPGIYKVTLTAAECQTPIGTLAGKSSTANISIMPITIHFERTPDAAPGANGGLPTVDANNYVAGVQGVKNTLDDLNDLTAAQVNAEVDTALADVNLDHLVGTATGIPAVPAGTFLDQVMDDGTASYDRTTDSLQAIRDAEPHGTAMRGTDGAYTGTPPTAAAIADQVWDEAKSGHVGAGSFGEEVQSHALSSEVTGLNDPTAAAIADAIWDELTSGHAGAGSFGKAVADILADTNELQTDDVPGLIAALNDLSAADVNAEVVDALNVDTYAEPGQGAPSATATLVAKIGYLYKLMRNKIEQTSTTLSVYDDAGTTVDQKATVSDDGTTYTRGELGTGP